MTYSDFKQFQYRGKTVFIIFLKISNVEVHVKMSLNSAKRGENPNSEKIYKIIMVLAT